MNGLIGFFIKQPMLVNIITLVVIGFGIYSAFFIKREAFPAIDFDTITVFTAYPGAAPEVVEKLITAPLEENLQDVDGIKTMQSVSTQSTSIISIELDPDVTNSRLAKSDIKDVVDSWRQRPQSAEDPVVTAINTKLFPVITVAITAQNDEVTEDTLRAVAKSLEMPIESLADVAKVRFEGLRPLEWHVDADPKKLKAYDISLTELTAALRSHNLNIPGGSLWVEDEDRRREMILRTVGELSTQQQIENTVIRANLLARPIRIGDVAQVKRGYEKRKTYHRTNGMPSQNIVVLKKEQGDIIHLVDKLKALMEEQKEFFPKGVSYALVDDSSTIVNRRLNVLTNNLIIGLILVLIILSLALPSKIAVISAFGIPFALLTAVALMYLLGISVNIISMLGLILVVGMLVDDAVVVTENAQRTMEKGIPPKEAALKSTQEIWPPLLTSVTTTMMAFAPLLFMGGTLGKFIQFVPYGVLLGLSASLFECFFILPNHIAHWIKSSPKQQKPKGFWQTQVLPRYGTLLKWIIKLRYLGILVMLLLAVGTMMLFKNHMEFMMFPRGGIAEFTIRTEGRVGMPLEQTLEVIKQVEQAVESLPDDELKEYESITGRFSFGNRRGVSGQQYGQVTVSLTDQNDRDRSVSEIIDDLKQKIGEIPDTKIRFSKRRAGPPVGRPVSIGVRGEDYTEIQMMVQKVKKLLADEPGVSDISDTFTPGKEEIHVNINFAQAAAAGLTLQEIGEAVKVSFEGMVPTTIRRASEEVDIRVRLETHHNTMDMLKNLTISNRRGQRIPLNQVAHFENRPSIASYEREANKRQIVVEADINYKQNTPLAVNASMKNKLQSLKGDHPGISFFLGGEQKDTEENSKELLRIVIITFCGIFLLLTLLFNNIFQPFLISLTIPLAVLPVIWAFYFHGMTLTFFALIGMVALAGVIINNAIVLTSFMNTYRKEGMSHTPSIIAACKTRLRPIFLTTITTVSGILPTAYGIGGLDPFVVPLAMALGWGLAMGSVLVCLGYPIFLAIFDDASRIFTAVYIAVKIR